MPYNAKVFIFTVSLCAMLAVNPVMASAPAENESVGQSHDVYVESALNQVDAGIASVTYVNRMVNAVGQSAQNAENHAAAAGEHALSAAASADAAEKAVADKVSKAQGDGNEYKAMVTNEEGSVYAGYVAPSMIANGGKINNAKHYSGFVLWSDHNGNVSWKSVDSEVLAKGAVTSNSIANHSVTEDKMLAFSQAAGVALLADGNDGANWGQVGTAGIADGAVTSAKIANGAVTTDKIADGAVLMDKISAGYIDGTGIYHGGASGQVLVVSDNSGGVEWGQIGTAGIAKRAVTPDKISGPTDPADAGKALVTNATADVTWGQIGTVGIADKAVTLEKTAGVVGVVPMGAATATTYGQLWVE